MRASLIEKLEKLMPKFPCEPPGDPVTVLKKRGYLKKDALVYRIAYVKNPLTEQKEKMVKVVCTDCGETAYLEHVPGCDCRWSRATFGFIDPADKQAKKSYDCCVCPCCGRGLTAKHIGDFKQIFDLDNKQFLTVHNIEGNLAVLSWIVTKYANNEGKVRYGYRGFEGIVVVDGTLVRVKKYNKFMSSYSWLSEWEYCRKYQDELSGWDNSELIGWRRSTVEKSNCANSALCEYMREGVDRDEGAFPGRYLQTWLKHPQVENLVRQGYSKYVTSVFTSATVIDNYYSSVYQISQSGLFINWKEVKPLRMLGLKKSEAEIAKGCTLDEILLYRRIRDKRDIKLTSEQIKAIGNDNKHFYAWAVEDVNGYNVPIVRTINYLQKQKKSHKGDLVSASYLQDYWNMLYAIYGSMVESELYPKDIVEAHDRMVARKQEKESAELQVKFDKRFKELEPLSFVDETLGLLIRPCKSQLEMIAEGKALHHCVGGYARTHAAGGTSILFVRKIDAPDIPYYTLEYSGGRVVQNRGNKNCSKTPEVQEFEDKWLEHIKTLKKGKKNGKQLNKQKQLRAGA